MPLQKIAVLGLGKVGTLAAKLLHHGGFVVTGFDNRTPQEALPFPVQGANLVSDDGVRAATQGFDAVLSCLPFRINQRIATAAHARGMHYFDLTEDVPTTQAIIDLGKTARGLMAPQCGLAPGFVGIVGAAQVAAFEECRSLRLRVGALPQHPTGLMGYAFNWSPEGVVNEYLNDCEVIEGGVRKTVSSMEWHETLYVEGVMLEAFTTSGGLGTICETFHGKVANVDYKTMRYAGHTRLDQQGRPPGWRTLTEFLLSRPSDARTTRARRRISHEREAAGERRHRLRSPLIGGFARCAPAVPGIRPRLSPDRAGWRRTNGDRVGDVGIGRRGHRIGPRPGAAAAGVSEAGRDTAEQVPDHCNGPPVRGVMGGRDRPGTSACARRWHGRQRRCRAGSAR
jgi:hypothetical protein